MTPTQRTLALDPASRTGFAHSDGTTGVWPLTRGCLPGEHLERLRRHILDFVAEHKTTDIAYEEASFASRNPHTAAFHNRMAGIIEVVAYELRVNVHPINPSTWKATMTGSGRSSKGQGIRACKTLFGVTFVDDNESDAYLILKFVEQQLHLKAPKMIKKREKIRRKSEPKLFK